MKLLLRMEEIAQLAAAIIGLCWQPVSIPFWLWPVVFLSPDMGMLGYLINTRVGAATYNLFHHKAVAACLMIAGYFLSLPWLLFAGLVLYAHSAFDRMMGYGLKYNDSFGHTHLGMVGRKS